MAEQVSYPSRTYVTGPNDSWENIARVNDIPVEVLLNLNGFGVEQIDFLFDKPLTITIPIVPPGTEWEAVMGGMSGHYEPKLETDVPGTDPVATPETAKDQKPIALPPYAIKSEDDLLRYMWVHEWRRDAASFDKNKTEAEKLFRQYIQDAVNSLYLEINIEDLDTGGASSAGYQPSSDFLHLWQESGANYLTVDEYLSQLSEDQLLKLYSEMYGMAQDDVGKASHYQDINQYISSYQDVQSLEQGEALPFKRYADYQSDLALADFYERVFKTRDSALVEQNLLGIAVNLVATRAGRARVLGLDETETYTENQIVEAIYEKLGSNPSIDDLVNLLEGLYSSRERGPLDPSWMHEDAWPQDPEMIDLQNQQRMAALSVISQYHDAQALDNLRKIVYDPTWNPAEEERLLGELNTAIGQVTRTIIGVDIGFVQDGLRQFHDEMKKVHDWRMELKASIDAIEVEMLARRDEEKEPLWWLLEIPLSILFEPLDWLFTIRDVLQGDMLALVGFLPFVPSALRHIADAGRYLDGASLELLGKLDELNEVMPQVDEFDDSWIKGITGSRNFDEFVDNPSRDAYYALGYPLYNEITDRNEASIIASISSNNPDIPEDVIRQIYNHVFTEHHKVSIKGKGLVTGYFSPDPNIGYLWLKAMGEDELAENLLREGRTMALGSGSADSVVIDIQYLDLLAKNDPLYLNRLLAHEYIESELIKAGYNYNFPEHINAHELSTVQEPTLFHPFSSLVTNGFVSESELDELFSKWLTPTVLKGQQAWKFEFSNLDELTRLILSKIHSEG